ncbi:MAG: hypothetical protein HC817_01840 [Saprospiraceae bacterium]|nr:hypothetical protein [Saprospiraceae bacterium]
MSHINQRLQALRQQMAHYNIDAYIVPSSDPHQSEYVAPFWQARQWLSGFDGFRMGYVISYPQTRNRLDG